MKPINHRDSTRLLAAVLLITGGLFAGSASASFGDCAVPIETAIPNSIKSQDDADRWSVEMENYVSASAEYLQCLRDYGNATLTTMSEEEESALRDELDRYVSSLRQTSELWNRVHGKFLDKQARSRE